jgi:prepilin-type processing-associated H-X9-DG protein
MWKSDAMKDLRELVAKSGDEAMQAFDKRFVPALSSLDRITFFMLLDERRGPIPVVSVAFSKGFDAKEFLKISMPKSRETKVGERSIHFDPNGALQVSFIDDKTMLVGFEDGGIGRLFEAPISKAGPLAPALELATKNKGISGAFNTGLLPAEALRGLPRPLFPLAMTKRIDFALDLEKGLEVKLNYASSEQAGEAEKSLKVLCKMGIDTLQEFREMAMKMVKGDGKNNGIGEMPMSAMGLVLLGSLKTYEDFLNNPPVVKQGDALKLTLEIPNARSTMVTVYVTSIGLLLPAVQKVREAASRAQSQNNLKQIALAMHNYESAFTHFPSAAIVDKKGKPLLSWRVTILPFIEQDALYREFKLDEPWDSEHNKKLISKMPKLYALPNVEMKPGETNYRLFYGRNGGLDFVRPSRITDFTDGTSNTIMCVEAEEGAIWTKPDDFEYDPKKPLPKMADFGRGGFNVSMWDGSVRFIRSTIKDATLRAMITRNGGEVIDFNE